MRPENKGEMPGVISSSGRYWRDQRRFLLKNLKDFGFGRSSMENLIQEEMDKLKSMKEEPSRLAQWSSKRKRRSVGFEHRGCNFSTNFYFIYKCFFAVCGSESK